MVLDCEGKDFENKSCQRKRLKENCSKFNGKVVGNSCKVGKFNMARADFLFSHKPKTQQHIIMSPQEFLDVVPPEKLTSPEQRKKLKERIKQRKPVDPAFLDVDVDTCQILSHEGRNRAIVSEQLGIKKFPVVIFNKEFDEDAVGMFGRKGFHYPTKRKNKCKRFLPQKY